MIIIIIPILILYLKGEYFHIYNDYPQSDVVHQSVFELVHSEDREELQRQLHWNSFLTPDQATIPLQVKKKTKQKNDQATIPLQVDNLSSLSPQNLPFLGDSVAGELTPVRKIIYRPFSLPFRQHIRVPGKRHDYVIYGVHIMDGP